ncbi:DUF6124 family protein [Pseudomonas akapageensis]|uniref:DUF6124 family protein n=1 Tax=Pseudomonas akapageensis TaxID=2609961 RepID=UPI00140DE62F|nr:DUF3077 domain-containing protein [Pseudomonas akapageensis]
MIKPSPNPPQNPVTRALTFGHCPGSNLLFSIRENIPLEEALVHACDHLGSATATAVEVANNCPPELQSLARSVMHQLDVAKALVEASIAGIEAND